jgi:hypothetical protein
MKTPSSEVWKNIIDRLDELAVPVANLLIRATKRKPTKMAKAWKNCPVVTSSARAFVRFTAPAIWGTSARMLVFSRARVWTCCDFNGQCHEPASPLFAIGSDFRHISVVHCVKRGLEFLTYSTGHSGRCRRQSGDQRFPATALRQRGASTGRITMSDLDQKPEDAATENAEHVQDHEEHLEDEEKILVGRHDVNYPALLTKDVPGG